MPVVLASFDSTWGLWMSLTIGCLCLGIFLAALLGWWVARAPGALLAAVVGWVVGGMVVRTSAGGSAALLASLPVGSLAGLAAALLLRMATAPFRTRRARTVAAPDAA